MGVDDHWPQYAGFGGDRRGGPCDRLRRSCAFMDLSGFRRRRISNRCAEDAKGCADNFGVFWHRLANASASSPALLISRFRFLKNENYPLLRHRSDDHDFWRCPWPSRAGGSESSLSAVPVGPRRRAAVISVASFLVAAGGSGLGEERAVDGHRSDGPLLAGGVRPDLRRGQIGSRVRLRELTASSWGGAPDGYPSRPLRRGLLGCN